MTMLHFLVYYGSTWRGTETSGVLFRNRSKGDLVRAFLRFMDCAVLGMVRGKLVREYGDKGEVF